jgi:Family of unknown function (DUF5906)
MPSLREILPSDTTPPTTPPQGVVVLPEVATVASDRQRETRDTNAGTGVVQTPPAVTACEKINTLSASKSSATGMQHDVDVKKPRAVVPDHLKVLKNEGDELSAGVHPLPVTPGVTLAPPLAGSNPFVRAYPPDLLRFGCLPLAEAVRRINTEYFVLRSSGKIYRQSEDGDLNAVADFTKALGGRWVEPSDPRKKPQAASAAWLQSPDRREYVGLQYCPNGIGLKREHLNVWNGWGDLQQVPGECSIIVDHIRGVLSPDNDLKAEFLLNWLADILQNPTRKPGVAVALRGSQGSGKSVLAAIMRKALGPQNVLTTSERDRILGRFNSALLNKILLVGEEMLFAGDHATTDKLKHIITGQTLNFEFKFGEPMEIESYHRLLLTSNHEQMFQAASEERRFVVYDVADTRRGEADYFDKLYAVADGRDDATAAAFKQFLLDRDLRSFRPWEQQKLLSGDDALVRQKELSLTPPLVWLREILDNVDGELGKYDDKSLAKFPAPHRWPPRFRRRDAVQAFREWAQKAKPFRASEFTGSEKRFWAEIHKVIPLANTCHKGKFGERYVAIELAEVEARFERFLKGDLL